MISSLPYLNVSLNALTSVQLILAVLFIKRGNKVLHKRLMLGALCSATLFLASYLIHHYFAGVLRYQSQGVIRVVYLIVLVTHTFLAVAILPMIFMTFRRALLGEFEKHKKIGPVTFLCWLYVSVTGVLLFSIFAPNSALN